LTPVRRDPPVVTLFICNLLAMAGPPPIPSVLETCLCARDPAGNSVELADPAIWPLS